MTTITLKIKDSGETIFYFTTEGTEINIHTLEKEYLVEIE